MNVSNCYIESSVASGRPVDSRAFASRVATILKQIEEETLDACARALAPSAADWWDAFANHGARVEAFFVMDGAPLPPDWAMPIDADDVVVAVAKLPADARPGIAAIIASARQLPSPHFDEADHERLARALVEALLEEVVP